MSLLDSTRRLTRRRFVSVAAVAAAAAVVPLLDACGGSNAPAAAGTTSAGTSTSTTGGASGQATSTTAAAASSSPVAAGASATSTSGSLPAGAASADKQVFTYPGIEGKNFDATANIYQENGMAGYAWEPLVWLDADYKAWPGAAEKWELASDGVTWTFNLRPNAQWSDGSPATADDWVFALQRMFDPKTANPYVWFYASIKNATAISKGTITDLTQLGVQKKDTYTLTITTTAPTPYFLQVVGFIATVVPKAMVEKYGNAWATKPETALSNGPYMVQEWSKGKQVVFVKNPHYDGPAKGKLEKIVETLVPQGSPSLPMFQANEIDWLYVTQSADLSQAVNDPSLKKDLSTFPAFTTYYMFFNTDNPPFNNLKVRQAFSHAIDRVAICKDVMQGLEVPAYTMLPAGFPDSQATDPKIQAIQAYDPNLAKQLLAEAGYPGGKGFPSLDLLTRQGQIVPESVAIQRMLKTNLGVTVTPKDIERSTYMDQLGKHQITLGLIAWAEDYADPTDFLDWWTNQSRHTWKNLQFNQLVDQAGSELDPAKRKALYNQAEKILISDVGAVFIGNPVQGELWQPQVAGLVPRSDGVKLHYQRFWSDIYIKA
ncbi:MAG TPA: peptide ABC transporter substrate-binding protein [Thermomicrobiaceae bacterium]|nr:peptide ABC transporter substrate-binding protein [Thermomicrobiaceae bacterium]